jgi:DNA-binding transcriptional LysR family regulator
MRDVTVRQLQIFVSAARHLSFSRASEELHLTQPAISMQMKQLEGLAGLPLFERVGRRLALTPAGEALLRHAHQVMQALRDAEDALAALKGLRHGRIAIAVVSTAKYFAPKLLALFARKRPGVEVRLLVNNRDAVGQLLAGNEVDLALMGTPPGGLDLVATPFARHPLVIIAHPEHRLGRRRRVPVEELEAETFLVRELGSGTRAAMERFLEKARVRPAALVELASNETIKQAVMAGMGVAFISQHAIGLELATSQLAILAVEGLPVMRNWNVVRRREKVLSPAAAAFEAFVLDEGSAFLARWPVHPGPPPPDPVAAAGDAGGPRPGEARGAPGRRL